MNKTLMIAYAVLLVIIVSLFYLSYTKKKESAEVLSEVEITFHQLDLETARKMYAETNRTDDFMAGNCLYWYKKGLIDAIYGTRSDLGVFVNSTNSP